jgi:hypothetical protein
LRMPSVQSEALDLRVLAFVRIAMAALILVRTTPILAWTRVGFLHGTWPLLGWPTDTYHAALGGWSWPPAIVAALCIARTCCAMALLVGLCSRVCGIATGVLGYLVLAQDELVFVQTLHLLYASAILLGLTDCGCAFALRRDNSVSPQSSVWLLRIWVASIYFWASLAKISVDWFSGNAFATFYQYRGLAGPVADILFATETRRMSIAICVMLVELVLGPALLFERTRKFALTSALLFHISIEIVARPDVFGYAMCALLLVFLSPAAHRASTPAPAGHTTSA